MHSTERFIQLGNLALHVQEWPGNGQDFVLLHGLSSNKQTWNAVAARLHAAGHRVLAVDQRGHGQSEKPGAGYDFATITGDLHALLDAVGVAQPIVVGQSWGGNVVLEFGARYPGRAAGLGFVDGGFLDLRHSEDASWEEVAARLRPPDVDGTPRAQMEQWMRQAHPDWSDEGIAATLQNFATLSDGTLVRRLPIPLHMKIVRAMWEQDVPALYPQVQEPVLIAVAGQAGGMPGRAAMLAAAERGLARVAIQHFPATDHDIHVHRPHQLAESFLHHLTEGIWQQN